MKANNEPPRGDRAFVLYWMIAFRRTGWNYALDRAMEWAVKMGKPLVVFEPLRVAYPWASDRFHRFIIDGMADNARKLAKHKVLYYPYIEPFPDRDKGLLNALSQHACIIISDDFPAFFLPRMGASAAAKVQVLMEKVDSNGLFPIHAADRAFPTAFSFRRHLQKNLGDHLLEQPKADPFKGITLADPQPLPSEITKRWPPVSAAILDGDPGSFARLPIDHRVSAVEKRGGSQEAAQMLSLFLERKLSSYPENRNHPDDDGASGLSPYLHFGHISTHQILHDLAEKEDWFMDRLAKRATGKSKGWWGMSEGAEAFLDELITWREVGFNMSAQREDHDQYQSLPEWALTTLKDHQEDRRSHTYSLEEFETAGTHDSLWNAAQRQLVREGRIHNYLRMLWGKKILEWNPSARDALNVMVELNNKYALDGRDPNSYSGIMWILGRYDRPWGPERPVFGKVRYMSSVNTARKVRCEEYLSRYAS
jgi:deoxyribodipyrimidine photo-lyase